MSGLAFGLFLNSAIQIILEICLVAIIVLWGAVTKIEGTQRSKTFCLTKETNVAHALHHPEKPFKFSQIHSKRGNTRNGGCGSGIVNIHRLLRKGRHTINAKMSHLKDLGITSSL